MKKFLSTALALICGFSLFAQNDSDTTYWKNAGSFAINFTQVSFTNWAAGGQNAISGVSKLNYSANFKKDNIAWDNIVNLGYGLSKVEGLAIQKSEDIIDLQSKFGLKASDKWYYSASAAFLSQFAPGYSDATNTTLISNLFSPASLNLAIGMDYKPTDKIAVLIAPLAAKATFILDETIDETNYGLEAGKTSRLELGASLKTLLNAELMKNVGLTTELGLFSNYLNNPQNVDVDWKVALKLKVNEYLSAQIDTRLLYDADIIDPIDDKAKVQFKELLGIGLSFSF